MGCLPELAIREMQVLDLSDGPGQEVSTRHAGNIHPPPPLWRPGTRPASPRLGCVGSRVDLSPKQHSPGTVDHPEEGLMGDEGNSGASRVLLPPAKIPESRRQSPTQAQDCLPPLCLNPSPEHERTGGDKNQPWHGSSGCVTLDLNTHFWFLSHLRHF